MSLILIITVIALTIVHSMSNIIEETLKTKSPILCHRKHCNTFNSFIADRWNAARISFGLPHSTNFTTTHHYNSFVRFQSGIVIFTAPDNKTDIPYARIYKCANEAIVQNLFFGKRFNHYPPTWITIRNYDEFNTYKNSYSIERPNRVLKQKFTFVRDPAVRFESAFAEAIWQTNEKIQRQNLGTPINVTSVDDIKSLFVQFLELNNPFSPRASAHLSTMSNVFFEYDDVDIVGNLESFLTDWQSKIITSYNLDLYDHRFNHNFGKHNSAINHPGMDRVHQVRKNSARYYYQQLLETEYVTGICHLIMIDYVCLPKYALPAKCQHLNPILNAGRKLLELDQSN